MELSVLQRFDCAAYHMAASAESYAITSKGKVYLYDRTTGIRSSLPNSARTHSTCWLKNQLLLKKMNGAYYLYSCDNHELHQLYASKTDNIAENIHPVALPMGDRFLDFCFFSPSRQFFLFPILQDLPVFLEYPRTAPVQQIFYDLYQQKIGLLDTEALCLFSGDTPAPDGILCLPHLPGVARAAFSVGEDYFVLSIADRRLWQTNIRTGETREFDSPLPDILPFHVVISQTHAYAALVFAGMQTMVFSLRDRQHIATIQLPYMHFTDFCDEDTGLLVGSWEKGYHLSFHPDARHVTFSL